MVIELWVVLNSITFQFIIQKYLERIFNDIHNDIF